MFLKTVLNTTWRKGRACAPRRVALHINCDWIHRNVGCSQFDMDCKRSAVTTQALGANPKPIDGCTQLLLELCTLRIGTGATDRACSSPLGHGHALI
jgi:hypothetical protein